MTAMTETPATKVETPRALHAFADKVLARVDPERPHEVHLMNHPERGWDSYSQVWTWAEISTIEGWRLGEPSSDEHGWAFWLHKV